MYKKQHKFKALLTSISSILLSTVMLLTSINLHPLTVHAIDGNNGNLQTIPGTVSTYPYGFNDLRQGYRFYVIDNTGNVVSKVVDFVYSTPNVANEHWYKNPRWSPLSTDGSNYECKPISELKNNYCAGADPNPQGLDITSSDMYPVHIKTQTYVGSKFQLWFLGELGRDLGISYIPPSASTDTGATTGTTTTKPPVKPSATVIDSPDDLYRYTDRYSQEYIHEVFDSVANGNRILSAFKNVNEAEEYLDNRNSNYTKIIYKYDVDIISFIKSSYKGAYTGAKDADWSDDMAKKNAVDKAYKRAKGYGFNDKTAKAIVYLIANGSSSIKTISMSTENLLNTNIPLSGNTETERPTESLENLAIDS